MTDPQEPAQLDRVLDLARHVEPEPPEGFVATIMRRVDDLEARRSWWDRVRRARAANRFRAPRADTVTGRMIMKKVVWGAAALGAADGDFRRKRREDLARCVDVDHVVVGRHGFVIATGCDNDGEGQDRNECRMSHLHGGTLQ